MNLQTFLYNSIFPTLLVISFYSIDYLLILKFNPNKDYLTLAIELGYTRMHKILMIVNLWLITFTIISHFEVEKWFFIVVLTIVIKILRTKYIADYLMKNPQSDSTVQYIISKAFLFCFIFLIFSAKHLIYPF